MKRFLIAVLFCSCGTASAANDINTLGAVGGQANFKLFSEDMGAAVSYKALSPAEPLGLVGFDVGIEVTTTTMQNDAVMDNVSGGDGYSVLPVPKLHAHKGLPYNFDVGMMYSEVPSSSIRLTGFEARYSLVSGNTLLPAFAVRGTWSNLQGVDKLDMQTKGLEVTVSKGFLMFTPYAGVGNVWVTSTPDVASLTKEELSLDKWFVGANMNMGLLNLAVELDETGGAQTVGGKLGVRF